MRSVRTAAVLALSLGLTAAAFAATPVIVSIDPNTVVAGSPSFTLTVNGGNFAAGIVIRANGSSLGTNLVSSSQATATVPSTLILNAGTLNITATNPGSGASSAVALTVIANQPQITTLDPPSVPVGNANVDVTVNGTAFASSAIVRVNNAAHPTKFVSDKQLTVTLAPADISHTGSLSILVVNPNNKLSNTVTLPVTNGAVPSITLLNPNTVNAGAAAFTLTVVGSNFVSNSIVKVGSTSKQTTVVDSSHLTAPITAAEVKNTGTLSVTVLNPNNQVSQAATLTIANGNLPTITLLSPSSVVQGSAAFTLTVTGTNFVANTKVNVGTTTPRNATIVDSTHLTVGIFASDVINPATIPITVTTPGTTGGTSNVLNLTVVSKTAPQATSMTPTTVAAGSADFKLLITGSNFKLDDVVQFKSTALDTEFISATQIAATVTAAQVKDAGTADITVTRKDGSATSAPLTLTITTADAPNITSLSPAIGGVGGTPFTLVIKGTNFTSSSIVTLDTAPRDTTFVNSSELHINITAADLAAAHQFDVQVINAGNVASVIVPFVISVPVPSITTISPETVVSGSSGFQLKVTGENFSPSAIINVNGTAHSTQVQQSTGALLTTVTDAEIATYGSIPITVTDNGVTSAAVTLNSLRPVIESIDPAAALAGSLSVTIRVSGSAFLPTSKILFKSVEQITTFNTDGSLTTTINGADLITPGEFPVNVRNSPLSLSVPVNLLVTSPGTPQVTSVAPVTVGATTITVNGSSFVPLSVVRINGADRTTTFLGGNQLSANLENDAVAPGTFVVSVRNPDGTVSNNVTVTVTGAAVVPIHRRGARH